MAIMHGKEVCVCTEMKGGGLGHVECVKELLKVGCSPEILCNGTPVLQLALIYANLPHLRDNMMEIVDHLCRLGAPLTLK